MRMASYWSSLVIHLLLLQFPHTIYADVSISLNNELTNFIPQCAQECFVSFLANNFPTSICTANPTLDCLCSSSSTSGFTFGEGAIQCIISEINIGFCKGDDAEDSVVSNALSLCKGVENALPNTHKTITATLVVQTTQPSIVLIAHPSTTIALSSKSTVPSTTRSTSSSSVPSTTSTLAVTSTSSFATFLSPSQSVIAPSEGSSQAPPETGAEAPTLSKPQIVGITVAAIGGAAVLFGLVLLCACLKRRRRRQRDSDMLPFQADPFTPKFGGSSTESEFSKSKSPFGNGVWSRVPPPVPPRLDTSDPYMFSRKSIVPNTIGVAISPERAVPSYSKRISRLLPAKPLLTLETGQTAELPGSDLGPPLPIYAQMTRQSTATQFEEDDDSPASFSRVPVSRIAGPLQAHTHTIKVVPPEGIPTTFFDTSNYPENPNPLPPAIFNTRNDVPYHPQLKITASPNFSVKPLALGKVAESYSWPRPPQNSNSRTQEQMADNRPETNGSVLSSTENTAYDNQDNMNLISTNSLLAPYPAPLRTDPRKRKSARQSHNYDRGSSDTVTTFASEETSPINDNGPGDRGTMGTIMMDLSPVAESPASPASATGVSPVSYPKIPPRLSQSTLSIKMVPPPAQPDFTSVFSSGLKAPRGQSTREKPWQAAEIAAARQRRLSMFQEQMDRDRARGEAVRQAQLQAQQTPNRPIPPKLGSPFQPRAPAPLHLTPQSRPREYIAPSAYFNARPPTHLRNNSGSGSIASQNSTNSSLLAKRLGVEKAAALQLQTKGEPEKQSNRWRVLDEHERERAKEAGWRPQLGRERENLPRTPGWIPKLTPTRRGDELFLSVA